MRERIARRVPVTEEGFTLTGTVSKSDPVQQIVFGWAYVSHDVNGEQIIDKSGEMISDPEQLETAAYDFMLNSRVGKDWHDKLLSKADDAPAALVVESVFFSKEKQQAMGIPDGVMPVGWWVGIKILKDDLWNAYLNGERSMFSVHGKALARRV